MKQRIQIDQLYRSNRTTISLIIDRSGSLIVRAPLTASEREINRLIESKRDWIEKKQYEVSNRVLINPEKKYTDGDLFYFLGKHYPLKLLNNPKYSLEFKDGVFYLSADLKKYGREIFEQFYRQNAKTKIVKRAIEIAEQLGINYREIKISSARKRWGSCSSGGNLNFSWRLVMAPDAVIDYVIVHEFAHLWEMNHSRKFWEIVGRMMPGYREPYKVLKEYGHLWDL